ncbi:hypothetical protein G9A89_013154 [Geosiphon pyriformis]|nr:hypothetical protein G9A89_013154 [Geosiphon pyriformis]
MTYQDSSRTRTFEKHIMASLSSVPSFENLELIPQSRNNRLFSSIVKTLLHNGNAWMSAKQLVEGCRKLHLAKLGGNTPASTIQGTISTALSLAEKENAIPPVEKQKNGPFTFYRISPQVFPGNSSTDDNSPNYSYSSNTTTETHLTMDRERSPNAHIKFTSSTSSSSSSSSSPSPFTLRSENLDTDLKQEAIASPEEFESFQHNAMEIDQELNTSQYRSHEKKALAADQAGVRTRARKKADEYMSEFDYKKHGWFFQEYDPSGETIDSRPVDSTNETNKLKREQEISTNLGSPSTANIMFNNIHNKNRERFPKKDPGALEDSESETSHENHYLTSKQNQSLGSVKAQANGLKNNKQNMHEKFNAKSDIGNKKAKREENHPIVANNMEYNEKLKHSMKSNSTRRTEFTKYDQYSGSSFSKTSRRNNTYEKSGSLPYHIPGSSKEQIPSDQAEMMDVDLLTTFGPSDFDINPSFYPSTFAVAQEIGYGYPRSRNVARIKVPSKITCEDTFCIKDLLNTDGSHLARLFCLADGHGGQACSLFLKENVPILIEKMLQGYNPEELDKLDGQDRYTKEMKELIRNLNNTYLDIKRQQFLDFQSKPSGTPPVDDGSTLIINLFFGKYFINVNVGDSRTILATRHKNGKWDISHASEDHKPSLERLAIPVFMNGGEFVDHEGKRKEFDPTPKSRMRLGLKFARITPKKPENNLGIPYRNSKQVNLSLNVASTFGDLLFKLNPEKPVVDCISDVSFVKLGDGAKETGDQFMLMSSDGLFDHLWEEKPEEQNRGVLRRIVQKLDKGQSALEVLNYFANREERNLYRDDKQEWDDFTCILILKIFELLNKHRCLYLDETLWIKDRLNKPTALCRSMESRG